MTEKPSLPALVLGAIAFIAAPLVATSACAAGPQEKSSIMYYPVTGSNAGTVYANILKVAPKIAPNATFAFTLIATKTDKRTKSAGGACRYTTFATSAAYVFHLPQHVKSESLPKATLARWKNFQAYLLKHEEGHRDFWRECFRAYDAEAMGLAAASCEELDAKRAAIFTARKRACIAQDEAYDVIFRKEVLKEPFIAEAAKLSGPPRK